MLQILSLILLTLALFATPAAAQDFPAKTIRIVTPYPPGGPSDIVARLYAGKIKDKWGQAGVVENRTGASGNIAAQLVAKSPPDGYTLLLHASSLVINPYLYKEPGFDPFKDFAPISLLFDYKLIAIAHPAFPPNNIKELVAYAKANPGAVNFASAGGVGAPTHLAMELFQQIAGISLVHVPYAGGAPAVNDLMAGHVPLMFNNPTQSLEYIRAGKVKALATTGLKRSTQMPELPTVAELGYPGFDVGTWFALSAPAGTPPAIIDKLNGAVAEMLARPDIRTKLDELGLNLIPSTPAEFGAYAKAESERWGKVIKDARIEPN